MSTDKIQNALDIIHNHAGSGETLSGQIANAAEKIIEHWADETYFGTTAINGDWVVRPDSAEISIPANWLASHFKQCRYYFMAEHLDYSTYFERIIEDFTIWASEQVLKFKGHPKSNRAPFHAISAYSRA